jgi:hypothetical protein
MSGILETARSVVGKSRHIWIDKQSIAHFSQKLLAEGIKIPPWDSRYHFYDGGKKTVAYLLILDSLNFCFWPPLGKPRWEIEYKSEAASLKKAVRSGIPITKAEYLAELTLVEFKKVLGGRGELQLLKNRVQTLNELGLVLINEYNGKAHKLVESADNSAINLSRLLAKKLISFKDIAEYQGDKVIFYKRAQIFAADLYGAFKGKNWGSFTDMGNLTAFADYKLPQVLRYLGILSYDHSLEKKVDQMIFLDAGSPEEIEIRANTIYAVDLIQQELNRMGKALKAFEIDWILWNMGQGAEFKTKPYHRTLTIYY